MDVCRIFHGSKVVVAVLQWNFTALYTQLPDIGDANYSELEVELTAAAAALIATLKELLAAAKGAPMEQRMAAVRGFTQAYQEFLRAGVALAAVCQV